MTRRAYFIGRGRASDIRLTDPTVSRRHAELVITQDGHYHLTDCGSVGGTHVRTSSGWKPVRQAFVAGSDELRLGNCRIGVRELLARVSPGNGRGQSDRGRDDGLPQGPVIRNPETGEIEIAGD